MKYMQLTIIFCGKYRMIENFMLFALGICSRIFLLSTVITDKPLIYIYSTGCCSLNLNLIQRNIALSASLLTCD